MSAGVPFPRDQSEFQFDDRISYSTEDDTWLLVDDSNEEWEWNAAAKNWMKSADAEFEEMHAAWQSAYDRHEPTETTETSETADTADNTDKKRKASPTPQNSKSKKSKKVKPEDNRAIYITDLPLNASWTEMESTFTKYGGVIDMGVNGSKRIKMYEDEEGNFKGEALIVFLKKESVYQAIEWTNDTQLRPGDAQCPTMKVSEADPSYKKNRDKPTQLTRKERKQNERNRAQLNRDIAEWSSDDEQPQAPIQSSKYDKVVIIKHAFTLEELDDDAAALLEIKSDMREAAEEIGDVTNVVLWDLEPEGIITVRFRDADSAAAFAEKTDGRMYTRRLDCRVADERPKFKKSGRGAVSDSDDEDIRAAIAPVAQASADGNKPAPTGESTGPAAAEDSD